MTDKIIIRGDSTTYVIDNKEVTEAEYRERYPLPEMGHGPFSAPSPGAWPMKSEAVAVHPNQIEEATVSAVNKGVQTDFDRQGRPIFRDRGHRRRYLRTYGFHDRDGGYGD